MIGTPLTDPQILLKNAHADQNMFIKRLKERFPDIPTYRLEIKMCLLQNKIVYNELMKLSLRRI